MVVIARQALAHFLVADEQGVVHLSQVGHFDDIPKLPDCVVLGKFDAIGLICSLPPSGVLTVVYQFEGGEENYCSARDEEVRGCGRLDSGTAMK